jgi:hypothetical protein
MPFNGCGLKGNKILREPTGFYITSSKCVSSKGVKCVEALRQLEMPAAYLMLNRIQFGLTSLLARIEPTACWGDVLLELSEDAAPATDLGRAEAVFMAASPYRA